MHYLALATDYDGTLAKDGRVSAEGIQALKRLKESGRKLLLVTGREIEDLKQVFPDYVLFDLIVGENGALLYWPATREERLLTERANEKLAVELKKRNPTHFSVGRSVIATVEPYDQDALVLIRELGLELQVIFNKGSVMILPTGVNKQTGLKAALEHLGISPLNVVGVGDAENDHALLKYSGCGVAVANALQALKDDADFVMKGARTEGVSELIEMLLADDLQSMEQRIAKHRVLLGKSEEGASVEFNPVGSCLLVSGPSGSGKTRVTTSILERVAEKGFQFCVIDPEGDYERFPGTVRVGDSKSVPVVEEVLQLLENFQNVVVNLLGLPLSDRPAYFAGLLARIQDLKVRTGHPHWLVIDEAHHLFPAKWEPASVALPTVFEGTAMITVHPDWVSTKALSKVNLTIAVGEGPEDTLARLAQALDEAPPATPEAGQTKLDVITWFKGRRELPKRVRVEPGKVEHDRHQRKYMQGDLEEDAFFFRGPENKLNLRAQNLMIFNQIADGVDDETWLFHLKLKHYSGWIRSALRDEGLAAEIERLESAEISAEESRKGVREAIERIYTAAA